MGRPVLVGVGQVTQHVADASEGREPLDLGTEALRLAAEDAVGDGRLLAELDSLDLVNVISWQYEDLPGLLAQAVGATPSRAVESDWGGDRPTLLVDRAAARIARGESRIAAIVGAEALRSLELGMRGRGQIPAWTPPAGDPPPDPRDHVPPSAWAHRLRMPADVYPLYENGLRARLGLAHEDNQAWSGQLWAAMSSAAARNPDAWDPTEYTPDQVASPNAGNRLVAHPYTKLMTARIGVNQAAAVLLVDSEVADEFGIPESHRVSPLAGSGLTDPDDILARVAYDRAPAMEASLAAALERADMAIDDCDLLELYSCFPCVPKLAIDTLGLGHEIQPSVTGGLTFFGGPGNDYMLHAVVAMVRAIRDGAGETGLLYGNGGFLTKHHTLVVRGGTADSPFASDSAKLDEELQADIDQLPAPTLEETATGAVTIETFTVLYDNEGTPDVGIVVCRTERGTRVLAHADDPAALLAGTPVGAAGTLAAGDGVNHFTLA